MTSRVYVHIGAYKTGTTYLQQRLWANRDALAEAGILFPGWRGSGDHVRAFKHVLAREQHRGGAVPAQPWMRLTSAVREWDGATAVLSYEGISAASEQQVRRIVDELAPAEVHAVLTARDLVRVIPAMWQEMLQGGQTWSWPQYVATVTGPVGRTVPPGRTFWRLQDLARVAEPWGKAVGAARVHIVTVPPAGSPPPLLWERFGAALEIDPALAPVEPTRTNDSLDPASTELLRRVNLAVEGRLDADTYDRVLKGFVAKDVLAASSTGERLTLAPDRAAWARERGRTMAAELAKAGYPVSGDLADLVGAVTPSAATPATPEQALDAAVVVIEALVRKVGAAGGRAGRGRGNDDAGEQVSAEAPKAGSRPASRLVRQAYEKLRR